MALVVVVPGPGGQGGSRSATGGKSLGPLSVGPLSVGPVSVGPLSVGSGLRRTDPVQRLVTALSSSVRAVRGPVPRSGDVVVLDFADLFSSPPAEGDAAAPYPDGAKAPGEPHRTAAPSDAEELTDVLLRGWLTSATRIGRFEAQPDRRRRPVPAVVPSPVAGSTPGAGPDGSGDQVARAALVASLGTSTYFRGSPELADAEARAVARYLTDLKLRHEVRDRTQAAILPSTRVVVGHGLGAVIAYEALCALSDSVSVAFVSLSAAMCGPQEVFARLEPAPRNEQGHWPASIRRWSNVVAHSDPTAMIAPQLTERFGPGIEDEVIEIKSSCGELNSYLLDRATGRAVATGLAG